MRSKCNKAGFTSWVSAGDFIQVVAASRRVFPSPQVRNGLDDCFLIVIYKLHRFHIWKFCCSSVAILYIFGFVIFTKEKYFPIICSMNLLLFFRTCTTVSWTFRIFYEKVMCVLMAC
jgi:hypothetical protein